MRVMREKVLAQMIEERFGYSYSSIPQDYIMILASLVNDILETGDKMRKEPENDGLMFSLFDKVCEALLQAYVAGEKQPPCMGCVGYSDCSCREPM